MTSEKPTIYIVDDDRSVVVGFKRLMISAGYEVKTFFSAKELLASGNFPENSCLIMDVIMPEMNGFELQKELVRSGHSVPVIFVTAHDNKAFRYKAKKADAVAYFRKPVDGEVLLDAVRMLHREAF